MFHYSLTTERKVCMQRIPERLRVKVARSVRWQLRSASGDSKSRTTPSKSNVATQNRRKLRHRAKWLTGRKHVELPRKTRTKDWKCRCRQANGARRKYCAKCGLRRDRATEWRTSSRRDDDLF
ncbi:MAG: hypothetical protein US42_C0007G0010 [Candidatus Magasanikbacteria bacterium GW2011_GWC2_37_14]|uniref:Uncharacterized protein n=1 Tax=Candidatus Magasanikbacteria bacterium GW2011_GWC2_37_14 TaxID=1619046 RepID=A0A0G0IU06_9BACT|nr:MAG: hypothetical protein US42_C0007G0010 [Candidatus Magasanikbacteria bacterium GW2011_GWC2_37_14]